MNERSQIRNDIVSTALGFHTQVNCPPGKFFLLGGRTLEEKAKVRKREHILLFFFLTLQMQLWH